MRLCGRNEVPILRCWSSKESCQESVKNIAAARPETIGFLLRNSYREQCLRTAGFFKEAVLRFSLQLHLRRSERVQAALSRVKAQHGVGMCDGLSLGRRVPMTALRLVSEAD